MERARTLRKQMSYPEVLLWQRLRVASCGVKFRRQHPLGPYSLDFYCASAKLAFEIDGEVHSIEGAPQRDAVRDDYIVASGIRVIRIAARDVLADAHGTAASMVALASTPLHHRAAPGGPPPRSGEDQR